MNAGRVVVRVLQSFGTIQPEEEYEGALLRQPGEHGGAVTPAHVSRDLALKQRIS